MIAERKPFQDEEVIGFTPPCPGLGSSASLQWISRTPLNLFISTMNATAWSLMPERLAPFWVQPSRSHAQGMRQALMWSALSGYNSKNMKTGGIVSFPPAQERSQILPESEFFHGSTLHAMKWKEKISTSKTKLMESLCKETGEMFVCGCSGGWEGQSDEQRSTTLHILFYLSWQTSRL